MRQVPNSHIDMNDIFTGIRLAAVGLCHMHRPSGMVAEVASC